jgi:hypothetical protein
LSLYPGKWILSFLLNDGKRHRLQEALEGPPERKLSSLVMELRGSVSTADGFQGKKGRIKRKRNPIVGRKREKKKVEKIGRKEEKYEKKEGWHFLASFLPSSAGRTSV